MHLQVATSSVKPTPASPRCDRCVYRHDCGGREDLLFNCFDILCCGTGECDEVCPKHLDYFGRLAEVGGIRFDDLKPVSQRDVRPPMYIPHLPHQYIRHEHLQAAWASVTTYQLLRQGGLAVETGDDLRKMFNLAPKTQIVLRGVDEDESLERYWASRKRDALVERLQSLGPLLVIAPNFSHFGDVPRTDNLWNRRRQLLCIEEMAEVGMNVVPHLNDIVRGDWEFWHSYLRDNPSIRIVAKEFQTRCRNRVEGKRAISNLAELQQRLGRELHPIIVGGAQFTETLVEEFRRFTILDSRAIIGAFNRHRFVFEGQQCRLRPERLLPGIDVDVDALADGNVDSYSRWLARRARIAISLNRPKRKAG